QQRLGRDAAPVQADAAEIRLLDDCGLEAELCRTDRGDIAARTGADDDDVEGCVGHDCSRSLYAAVVPCARRLKITTLSRHSSRITTAMPAMAISAIGPHMFRERASPEKNAAEIKSIPSGLIARSVASRIDIQAHCVRTINPAPDLAPLTPSSSRDSRSAP